MRSKQSTTFNRKTGFIERIDLKIYPEELTLLPSENNSLYLLDAIREALIKDNKRALKEKKDPKKILKKKLVNYRGEA